MRKNIIIDTDSYKRVHWKMLPPGLTKLVSYGEPRLGGRYKKISWFGLQMIVQDHFLTPVTDEMIDEAQERSVMSFGTPNYFNREVWERVRDLGHLPVKIMSAPEGSEIEQGNVCFTIASTKDWFANTVNALESLLMHAWYPTAVATRSMYIKKAIAPYFNATSDVAEYVLPVAVNDFALRGTTCHEAAGRGGAGHLLHFQGSDNEPAMTALADYYGCKDRLKSVWATEHSVALSWGIDSDITEKQYLLWQLKNSDPNSIISVVIDTKDSDNFVQNIVADPEIVELIKNRPGRVVFRPDSGDPLTNILKYLDILGGIFGYGINKKGYKTLNSNVGLIQGDGMDEHSIPALYHDVTKAGWAADNFVTGSGGGLLQVDLNRDTSRWAIKPCFGVVDGKEMNMAKKPKTDMSKASKGGLLKLHPTAHGFMTIASSEMPPEQFKGYVDAMRVLYEDGQFYPEQFNQILARANK